MRKGTIIWMLICLVILGGWESAEAKDHFYVSFSIALGGMVAGGAGLFLFFFAHGTEFASESIPMGNALVTLGDHGLKYDVPDLVLRTSDSFLAGPQGIEGYACLFRVRVRFP